MPIIIKDEMITAGGRCPKRYKPIKEPNGSSSTVVTVLRYSEFALWFFLHTKALDLNRAMITVHIYGDILKFINS